jgi:hypothetical protein
MSVEGYDLPYDPNTDNFENETPTHDQVIEQAIDSKIIEVHTAIPSVITVVKGSQKVDIQPLLMRRYKDGTLIQLPVIQDVPVAMLRGADYGIKLPIAVGDTGIAIFSERSIDAWTVQGGVVDPADPRHHNLSDAIFYPGLYPFNNQLSGAANELIMTNGSAQIVMQKAGTFKIKNVSNELVDLISQLAEACSLITNSAGPTFNAATFTDLKALIDTLKGT